MYVIMFFLCMRLLAIKLFNLPADLTDNAQDVNSLNKFKNKHIANICFHAIQGELNHLTCRSKHTHFSKL